MVTILGSILEVQFLQNITMRHFGIRSSAMEIRETVQKIRELCPSDAAANKTILLHFPEIGNEIEKGKNVLRGL